MTNATKKIDINKIIKEKTRSFPFIKLDEYYIGKFLLENNFKIIKTNKQQYVHKNKPIDDIEYIDDFLTNAVKESDYMTLERELCQNILVALEKKYNIANKNVVKGLLLRGYSI